jgi:hypothetical protein
MNVEWTNMAGFGPLAWNHGGPPVSILMKPPRVAGQAGKAKPAGHPEKPEAQRRGTVLANIRS